MRSRPAIVASQRALLDPAQWLHEVPAQQAATPQRATALHLNVPAVSVSSRRTTSLSRADTRIPAEGLTVEYCDWEQAATKQEAWAELAAATPERNVFLEPHFALSAAQHFPAAYRPYFLIVSTEAGKIVALFAFQNSGFTTSFIGKSWCPPQMALGMPFIDERYGFAALDLIHLWFSEHYPAVRGILYTMIPARGPLAMLINAHARARGLTSRIYDAHQRAAIENTPEAYERLTKTIGYKRNKELGRLRKRLGELGKLEHGTARSYDEIKEASEQFLALEKQGWKGRRGTALICDASLALFMRTMTRRFAACGRIEIDSLRLDGRQIAMGIVIRSGDRAFYWKTCYDEQYASYSPGVQVSLDLSRRLLADPAIACIDSCALPQHPMINRIWPDRLELMDYFVALPGHSDRRFAQTANNEARRRRFRALAKKALYAIRGDQPS